MLLVYQQHHMTKLRQNEILFVREGKLHQKTQFLQILIGVKNSMIGIYKFQIIQFASTKHLDFIVHLVFFCLSLIPILWCNKKICSWKSSLYNHWKEAFGFGLWFDSHRKETWHNLCNPSQRKNLGIHFSKNIYLAYENISF